MPLKLVGLSPIESLLQNDTYSKSTGKGNEEAKVVNVPYA
jgi:hypothetical protein